MVLRTFSPARAWRPAVGARLARTLGLIGEPCAEATALNTRTLAPFSAVQMPASRERGHTGAGIDAALHACTPAFSQRASDNRQRCRRLRRQPARGFRVYPAPGRAEAWTNNFATTVVPRQATKKCLWLALRAAVLRLAVSLLSASPRPQAAGLAAQLARRRTVLPWALHLLIGTDTVEFHRSATNWRAKLTQDESWSP